MQTTLAGLALGLASAAFVVNAIDGPTRTAAIVEVEECVNCYVCGDFWPWDDPGHETGSEALAAAATSITLGEGGGRYKGPPHGCIEGSPCAAHIMCGTEMSSRSDVRAENERLLRLLVGAKAGADVATLRAEFGARVRVNASRQVVQVLSCDSQRVIAQYPLTGIVSS